MRHDVCGGSACRVLSHCVVGYGMAVGVVSMFVFSCSLFLPLLPLFVLVFGVVRAQPCEHARYPRTPLRLSVALSSLLFSSSSPAFLRAPPFSVLEWRWVFHHVSECSVGMTAMGSLSLSSSFFW